MPNLRWDDDLLDLKFQNYDNQLEALRQVPMSTANLATKLDNQDEHLRSLSRDQREIKTTCEGQGKDIGEIKVTLATLTAKVGFGGAIGGLVGGGIVTLVVVLLSGHG
jgi:hypothetical protein